MAITPIYTPLTKTLQCILFQTKNRSYHLARSPELGSLSPLQLAREIVFAEYIDRKNSDTEKAIRLAGLKRSEGVMDNIKSSSERCYDDNVIEQLKTLEALGDRRNVAVFGPSNVDKSYFLTALGIKA